MVLLTLGYANGGRQEDSWVISATVTLIYALFHISYCYVNLTRSHFEEGRRGNG